MRKREALIAKLNRIAECVRFRGKVSVYEAADAVGIIDIGYFRRTYIPRLTSLYEDIRFDGRFLWSEGTRIIEGKISNTGEPGSSSSKEGSNEKGNQVNDSLGLRCVD